MSGDEERLLLPMALRAAAEAARVVMDVYRDPAVDLGVREKPDHTPVTKADMASNAAIAQALAGSRIPILSEETAHEDYDVRRSHRQMWIVDPLDGTKEFICRNDMFSVCIALVEKHRPVLGVIAVPATGAVYFTRGGAAWRAVPGPDGTLGDETRLPVAFGPVPHVVLGSVSHSRDAAERALEVLRGDAGWADARIVGVGSSIKQCMIAEGSAAIYPRRGTTMEWDTAAGQAIIEAAGGRVLRLSDGKPVDYNRPDLRNPDFVAVAAGVDGSIVSKLMSSDL